MNQVLFITIIHYIIIPKQCHSNKYSKRSQVQGSTFSAASDRRSGQFDQKSDAGLAESHTRVRDKDKIEDPKLS